MSMPDPSAVSVIIIIISVFVAVVADSERGKNCHFFTKPKRQNKRTVHNKMTKVPINSLGLLLLNFFSSSSSSSTKSKPPSPSSSSSTTILLKNKWPSLISLWFFLQPSSYRPSLIHRQHTFLYSLSTRLLLLQLTEHFQSKITHYDLCWKLEQLPLLPPRPTNHAKGTIIIIITVWGNQSKIHSLEFTHKRFTFIHTCKHPSARYIIIRSNYAKLPLLCTHACKRNAHSHTSNDPRNIPLQNLFSPYPHVLLSHIAVFIRFRLFSSPFCTD